MELKRFKHDEFGELQVITHENKEYVEAIQVATILGYSNPRDAVLRHCDKEGVVFHDTRVVTGTRINKSDVIQYVPKKYISEGNVYRLIIKSKLKSAKRFEKWVMEEVLPSIRKNGIYMSDEAVIRTLEDPDYIIQMASKLKKEKKEKQLAQNKAKTLETVLLASKEYTTFGMKVEASPDCITVGQFAKLLNNCDIYIGRNRLFSWFRENGYLIKNGKDKNIPKQVYLEQGLFSVGEKIINTKEDEVLSNTPLITGKGQLYFINKIKN